MKENVRLENWIAPNDALLPEFIIGGTMKSGTSTLHQILGSHPKIYIPKEEIHFFDIDNLIQHSDFNFYIEREDKWTYQTMKYNSEKMWDWYSKKFEGNNNYLKGEVSTTYLASRIAAERISIRSPITCRKSAR